LVNFYWERVSSAMKANYNLNPNMAVSVGGYYINVDKTFDSTETPHIFEKIF